MDAIKKQRKVLRTAFTKALNVFTTKMESDCSAEEKMVSFQMLEAKMTELETIHMAHNEALFKSNMAEDDIDKELESDDLYKTQYLTAKMKITRMTSSVPENATRTVPMNATKASKYPLIAITKIQWPY